MRRACTPRIAAPSKQRVVAAPKAPLTPRSLPSISLPKPLPLSMRFAVQRPATAVSRVYRANFASQPKMTSWFKQSSSAKSNPIPRGDGEAADKVNIDPGVREASKRLHAAQTDEEKLEALQELLTFAEDLDELPDMLEELDVPSLLSEMLESENAVLQRHAYVLLFDVDYSIEVMDFNRENFMEWINEMAEYQTKITDPLLLALHSALKNLLLEDADLRDTDAEAGMEVDEDLYEDFVQELLDTLPTDVKMPLLERLHDVAKAAKDWTHDESALWEITTFAEKIGLINFIGVILGTKTTVPEAKEDNDDTEA